MGTYGVNGASDRRRDICPESSLRAFINASSIRQSVENKDQWRLWNLFALEVCDARQWLVIGATSGSGFGVAERCAMRVNGWS
jgi:hypothetical protein